MSFGLFCWAVSAILFLLLGFDIINSTGKVDLVLIAAGLVPLGLCLSGWTIPVVIRR